MNFVLSLVQNLLAAVLLFSTVKTASIRKEGDKSKNEVVPFLDVFNKSLCQTREMLVNISEEYPEDIEYNYIPSCVVLSRCAGCCNDEALECVPTETHNVTMEVLRVRPKVSQHTFQLSFTEHRKCECRPKPEVQALKEKGKGRKRKRKRKRKKQRDIGRMAVAEARVSTTARLGAGTMSLWMVGLILEELFSFL